MAEIGGQLGHVVVDAHARPHPADHRADSKLCLRSCTLGWARAVRTPIAVVICLNVSLTRLRSSLVPVLERKKAIERGLGQRWSRSAA